MVYTVVDLFCGGGGFSQGFYEAGFDIVFAIDIDPVCGKTFKLNFPCTTVFVEDIRDIAGDDIAYLAGRTPDIVIGSPPCEPFTGANPDREKEPLDRLYKDPLGMLTLEYIRIVGELKPAIFVMENVPALNTAELRDALIREFRYVGYDAIYFNIIRAEDHGTPSHRTRLFISNIPIKPKPIKRQITVEEALRDISCDRDLPNNECVYPTERKLKKISKVRWGRALFYYRGASKRVPNYIRPNPNDIAPTVLGSTRFIHPYEDRLLTVREQARLMGFPDHHLFFGDRDQQYNQVGEAVPPPLAYAIARHLLNTYLDQNMVSI